MYGLESERVYLLPITALDTDTMAVVRWRNSDEARRAFWCTDVVTPDTHAAFVANRKPHDFVWIARDKETMKAVGMGALTVDVGACEAEWGKIFIDSAYRRGGYGRELVTTAFAYAFDVLNLKRVWIEAYSDNEAILSMYERVGLRRCRPNAWAPERKRPVTFMEMTAEMWRGLA